MASLIFIYVAASVLKLNGSSTAMWQKYAEGEDSAKGLIAGTPKTIRMDEWLVHTPWIWSQANQNPAFPLMNRNVGNGLAPLLTNLPVRHWTVLFRPQMWGFFICDRARAFAFNWNAKWFGLLLGGFLFLRSVARGNNFLALAGASLVLFSSYVQWFFSTPACMPEIVATTFFGLWAGTEMFRAKSRWEIIGAGLVLLVAIEQFVFCCYPRFQIPLAYLGCALAVAGATVHLRHHRQSPGNRNVFRICIFVAVLLTSAILLGQWVREVWPTIKEIESQIYPGRSISAGGSFPWYFFFAPFLEFSMTEDRFPYPFENVCDASGFLFLAPLLLAGFVREAWRRRCDPILLAVILFLAGTIFFMVFGLPMSWAQATGWAYVSPRRGILAVGIASIIGLVRYLALPSASAPTSSKRVVLISAFAIVLILFLGLELANSQFRNFATAGEVIAAAIFFGTMFFLFWGRRCQIASCLLLLIPCLYSYGLVNPISCGTPGLTKSGLFRWISTIHKKDPPGLWLVTGKLTARTCFLAQLVKATGATTLGGTRCMPDHEMLRVLDPANRNADVHNRYARICFQRSAEAHPAFKLYAPDYYLVQLPFQGELFDRLEIKYLLVVDEDENIEVLPGFERLGEREGCALFRSAPPH